ncbi:MAG: NifU family protein [Trebonia sp.]|jgi:Fe-S cluster biogenesis protein NfuA
MARVTDARTAGDRVEKLIAELRERAGSQAGDAAEELVGCLVELYGAGLATIVETLTADRDAGPRLLPALAADPLVESLLLVHDLHPLDTDARIRRALEQVRPRLGAHADAISYLGIDDEGVVQLRLTASGHGCGSATPAVRQQVAEAVTEAAPEVAGVAVEEVTGPAELPLLQIMRRPAGTR